jgi:hypothetical protein
VIVDSWLTWRRHKGSANGTQQKEFYVAVAKKLIDNNLTALVAASVSALPTSQRRWSMANQGVASFLIYHRPNLIGGTLATKFSPERAKVNAEFVA